MLQASFTEYRCAPDFFQQPPALPQPHPKTQERETTRPSKVGFRV